MSLDQFECQIPDRYIEASIRQFLHSPKEDMEYDTLDVHMMERFYDVYKDVVRRITETREWFVYDGKRWRADNDGSIYRWFTDLLIYQSRTIQAKIDPVLPVIKEMREKKEEGGLDKAEYAELVKLESQVKLLENRIKILRKNANDTQINKLIEKGLKYFGKLSISKTVFDSRPELATFLNGTIDVTKLKLTRDNRLDLASIKDALLPHRPEHMQTQIIAYDINPDAPVGTRFLQFVSEIHNNDPALVEYVQMAMGYTLTGYTTERCIYIQHGAGDNGKSTFNGLMYKAFGEYAETIGVDLLIYNKHKNKYESAIQMAKIRFARYVNINEPDIDGTLDISAVKSVTGGEDRQSCRILGKGYETFVLKAKIWVATNHMPDVNDHSPSAWKRIAKIPFETSFTGRMDVELKAKLLEEIAYIHLWLLEGAAKFIAAGMKIPRPEVVTQATAEYELETDDLREFLDMNVKDSKDGYVIANELYIRYTRYCAEKQVKQMPNNVFGKRIKTRAGWKSAQRKLDGVNTRVYTGMELLPDTGVTTNDGWLIPSEAQKAMTKHILSMVAKNPGVIFEDIALGTEWGYMTLKSRVTALDKSGIIHCVNGKYYPMTSE